MRLQDVCSIKHGFAFKGKYITHEASGYELITPGNFSLGGGFQHAKKPKYYTGPISEEYVLEPDDLIVTMTDLSRNADTLGLSALIPNDGNKYLHNQRIGLLTCDQKQISKHYLHWLLRTREYQRTIAGMASGSTVKHTSPSSILSYEAAIPDLQTQKRVAVLLDLFDAKIKANAKLNGYLADAVDGLFEKALGQAEEKTLTDVVEILSGGTPKTKISEYWEDGEIPFFGPGDANGSTYCLATAKRITQLGLENCNSELYPVDTVFLTARGTVGKVAMAGKPMAMNQSCFAFRGLGVSQPAVYQIIKRAVRSLKAKANGATFAAINTRDLKIEKILVPSDEELTAFEEEAASLHSMMRVNEEESLKLSSLRDALLPKLIAGEIDVSKIDFTQLNSHLA